MVRHVSLLRFFTDLPLAGLIFQRSLGRRRLAAPGSSDSPLIDQWSISIAVCRHPSDSCSLRADTSGPFLDLPPLCSFENARNCEGVGRYRQVVVIERVMPDFLHVVPIRDDNAHNQRSRQTRRSDAQHLYPALGWRYRSHQGGRVRPRRSPARFRSEVATPRGKQHTFERLVILFGSEPQRQ